MIITRETRTVCFNGLCINYLEGGGGLGVGKPEWGYRGKSQLERGGVDVKFIAYRGGGITFFTLFHKLEKW